MQLWTRAHEIAATIAANPPSATQGTVKAIWESLDKPYRAALDQGLIYTRLGNPIGKAELGRKPRARPRQPTREFDDAASAQSAHRRRARLQPDAPAVEYDGQWSTWGQVGELAQQIGSLRRHAADRRSEFCYATAPRTSPRCSACCWPAAPSSSSTRPAATTAPKPTSIELALPVIIGEPDDLRLGGAARAPTVVSISTSATEPKVTAAGHRRRTPGRPGVAVRMLTSGTTGPPKRVDLTYDMLAHSVMGPEPDQSPAPTELRHGVAIVNAPLVHIGGVFRVLQCVAEARPFVLLERFELDSVGRRGARASTARGVAGADGATHGAAFRPDLARIWRASAPSRRAPRRCPPRTPTRSPRSTEYRF